MRRRHFLRAMAAGLSAGAMAAQQRPNVVLIFTDDQGYGDLGCYGSPNLRTPNIDRMAREGARFTTFYAAPFCGPSRSALMTGCYPPRNSMAFNHGPASKTGLHPSEVTIARALKPLGYATSMIGKWHLGHLPEFLPTRHGFDEFYGLPYSHDMWPYHPMTHPHENEHPRLREIRERTAYTGYAGSGKPFAPGGGFPDLPFMEGEKVTEWNPDCSRLTARYTERAVGFLRANRNRPFFLYLAHNLPHVPLFAGEKFRGKSRRGLYGDVVEEIDWSTGAILDTLASLGLERRTLVIFSCDNGPWAPYGVDGGSAGPLSGAKGSTWEGGVRVPGIFRWPGRIPAGQTILDVAATIDVLPTVAEIAGARLPSDRVIDGHSLLPLLEGRPGARSPHDFFLYFNGSKPGSPPNLEAIRDERWKLHLTRQETRLSPRALYDLWEDPGEKFDRLKMFPDRTEALLAAATARYDRLRGEIRPLGGLRG